MSTARNIHSAILRQQSSVANSRIISIQSAARVVPPSGWKQELQPEESIGGRAPGAWPLPFGAPSRVAGLATRERRAYARANLRLPIVVSRIPGRREVDARLFTSNISSSGVFAQFPIELEQNLLVELKIELVKPALVRSRVQMVTQARVVRVEPVRVEGFWGIAFDFDDITFERDPISTMQMAS
ncbi:MAG TPA: PilZ domain-containing protein [Candidatus Acidoferrales bacterium]|nr:PilZ domain-containing protein [Candidatus Acidoferrales bacterium]